MSVGFNTRGRRALRAERGFTLLELVLVLLIAGIGLAVVVPSLGRQVGAWRVQQIARQLRATMEYARVQAIRSGEERVLIVDRENNAYWLVGEPAVRVSPQEGRLLPRGRWMDEEGQVGFYFYPDGVTSGGEVAVERVRGLSRLGYRVRLDPLLGTASVSEAERK
jgi:general secretion pathway protein H